MVGHLFKHLCNSYCDDLVVVCPSMVNVLEPCDNKRGSGTFKRLSIVQSD